MEQFLQRYIYSWRLNGWLIHDIFFCIVLSTGLLLFLFIVMKRKRLVISSILLIAFLFVSNLLMIVFGLAGRGFPIKSDSPIYTDDSQSIAVQMVQGSENNGTSNGITHLIAHHLLVAVNLQTGEKQWTKSASYKETLLGEFMGGVLVHHRDDEFGQLSLVDMETGKELLSEKDFRTQHPSLIAILSNNAHQMAVLENHLYLEGVDGKFYRFDGKTLSEDSKAQDYLSARFFIETELPGYFATHPQPVEDYQAIRDFSQAVLTEPAIQAYENLQPKVVDVDIIEKTALVSYRQTQRESAEHMLLLYDMNKHQVLWERNIGIINSQQQQPTVRTLENSYVIQAGDRLLVLDKKMNKRSVHYHLRWNRPIDE
ncbi:PA2928 family protein [Lysinibacillus capsici]|uniref:PA2928 family protein n=1 Tax=Lysinibacillus capsici TaxID=2115968 RepID=UPI0006CA57A6|nr:PA2928 family protein [Lysinibacillus sphaericus]